MIRVKWQLGLAAAAVAGLAACTPPYIDEQHLAFEKDHCRGCDGEQWAASAAGLPIDGLYALHLYGRSFHPWRGLSGLLADRPAEAVPLLRTRLAAATSGGEVGSIFDAFEAMQRKGTYDVRGDASLIASIQAAAHRVDDPGFHLRDQADEIETGEAKPLTFMAVRKWTEGLGDDYDVKFAKSHCRGCDYRDWKAGAEALPIDKLYAPQRYGWEGFSMPRELDHVLAARRAEAIPFLKAKLAEADRGLMLLNILRVIEVMREIGTFEARDDPELLALADAAAARVKGDYAQWNREIAERLRTGAPSPCVRP